MFAGDHFYLLEHGPELAMAALGRVIPDVAAR
jgi:hypothetical protein